MEWDSSVLRGAVLQDLNNAGNLVISVCAVTTQIAEIGTEDHIFYALD